MACFEMKEEVCLKRFVKVVKAGLMLVVNVRVLLKMIIAPRLALSVNNPTYYEKSPASYLTFSEIYPTIYSPTTIVFYLK